MSVDRATYRRIKTQILKAITKGVQVNGKHVFADSQHKKEWRFSHQKRWLENCI